MRRKRHMIPAPFCLRLASPRHMSWCALALVGLIIAGAGCGSRNTGGQYAGGGAQPVASPGVACWVAVGTEQCALVNGLPVRLTCDGAAWQLVEACPSGAQCHAGAGSETKCVGGVSDASNADGTTLLDAADSASAADAPPAVATCAKIADCDDQDPCTVDFCNPATKKCLHSKVFSCGTPAEPCAGDDCGVGSVCSKALGACVPCDKHADCGPGKRCVDHQCIDSTQCKSDVECKSYGGICDLDSGICVPCLGSQDCGPDERCTSLGCELAKACTSSKDCPFVCDVSKKTCVRCVKSADCPTGSFCTVGQRCRPVLCNTSACKKGSVWPCQPDGGGYLPPQPCADGQVCTTDSCVKGQCAFLPVKDGPAAACDDGSPCTTDVCKAGACAHVAHPAGEACGERRACDATGTCVCLPVFAGSACEKCANPNKKLPKCLECKVDFAGTTCGLCANQKKVLPQCSSCKPAFSGLDCGQCADAAFAGPNCDQCSNQKMTLPTCKVCFAQFAGSQCEKCANANMALPTCKACKAPYAGPGCKATAFKDVAAGGTHTCAIRVDGSAECWGAKGTGETKPPTGLTFKSVTAGQYHSCGLLTTGKVTCWGEANGQPPQDAGFLSVDAGGTHTCGVLAGGKIKCWGSNSYGQSVPPSSSGFAAVTAGGKHSCGLHSDGSVSCWGEKNSGQSSPPSGLKFKAVSAGYIHTCGVQSTGDVVCWGKGALKPPSGQKFSSVSAGNGYTCGRTVAGGTACWGSNKHLQFPWAAISSISTISVGSSWNAKHTCVLLATAEVMCFGDNAKGQTAVPTIP